MSDDRFKERGVRLARAAWQRAVPAAGFAGDPVGRYLRGRGALGEGEGVPTGLRFDPQCVDGDAKGPAMLAPFVGLDDGGQRRVFGVHRTFLQVSAEGVTKRPVSEAHGNAKKMLGWCSGHVIPLRGVGEAGVLIIAEGIETALACGRAWPEAGLWAAGSAEFLLEMSQRWPLGPLDARVHTVVFAADLNTGALRLERQETLAAELEGELGLDVGACLAVTGLPVGERCAAIAAERLRRRFPYLQVAVRVPTPSAAPGLVVERPRSTSMAAPCTARWKPAGVGGVDWLDVLLARGAEGPAAVREGLGEGLNLEAARAGAERFHAAMAAQPADASATPTTPTTPTARTASAPHPSPEDDARHAGGARADGDADGGAGGDGGQDAPWGGRRDEDMPILTGGPVERARRWLWEEARIEGQRRFALARWGGNWWVYRGGRYVQVDEQMVESRMWDWLNGFRHIRGGPGKEQVVPLRPGPKVVNEVLGALAIDTFVVAKEMPSRLPPVIDAGGRPMWGEASRFTHLDVGARGAMAAAGHSELRGKVVLRNGVLDVLEVARTGRVRLEPHTPELFTATCLPFDLPQEDLQTLVDGKDPGEVYGRRCPKWYGWLADAGDQDPEWERQLQQMMGDTISADRTIEKIFMVVGQQRGGKGIVQHALAAIVGEENLASTSFTSLATDRFGLAPLVGKSAAVLPDAHLNQFSEGAGAVEVLKAISGQDYVQVRDLHQRGNTVRLTCRVWVFCNEEPDLRDESSALANRLIVLPIRRSALGREDPTIKASVPAEAPGILLWSIMGAIQLARMERRAIEVCAGGREIQEEFERDSAHVKAFVADAVVAEDDGAITPDELYLAYEHWCKTIGGREPLGLGKFRRKVKRHVETMGGYSQPRGRDGERQRVLTGVRLRSQFAGPVLGEGAGQFPV